MPNDIPQVEPLNEGAQYITDTSKLGGAPFIIDTARPSSSTPGKKKTRGSGEGTLSNFQNPKVPPTGGPTHRSLATNTKWQSSITQARLRCAAPCQSRGRATWPPSRHPAGGSGTTASGHLQIGVRTAVSIGARLYLRLLALRESSAPLSRAI